MSPQASHRFRRLAALLALTAVAILVGLAVHGHHDDCHDYCWLCHSSLGSVGLPAIAFLILVDWSSSDVSHDTVLALHDLDANLHTAPRAPPRFSL